MQPWLTSEKNIVHPKIDQRLHHGTRVVVVIILIAFFFTNRLYFTRIGSNIACSCHVPKGKDIRRLPSYDGDFVIIIIISSRTNSKRLLFAQGFPSVSNLLAQPSKCRRLDRYRRRSGACPSTS